MCPITAVVLQLLLFLYIVTPCMTIQAVEVQILREKNIKLAAEEAQLHHLQQKNAGKAHNTS